MSLSINEEKNRIVRHGSLELAEHWVLALSGLALLLSGMFELPMAARYKITMIPGFGWSGDFIAALSVHYVASVVFIAAALFHLVYHGLLQDRGLLPQKGDLRASVEVVKTFFGKGEEPPFHKYLPEQRLAYLGMAATIAVIIVTGLVKTYKNVYAPDISHTLVLWSTWLHNIFFVLFILAFAGHIGAIVLKPNRPMVRGIFTGAVRLDYARRRHPLWLEETDTPASPLPVEVQEAMEVGETAVMANGLPAIVADEAPASSGEAADGTTETLKAKTGSADPKSAEGYR
jgi:cytochrome b subunit of formate dehydrogenase